MKNIVKNFNNLIKKTIFKVKNKTNNKFKISNFNKFLITSIGILFLYTFYLLTPLLYDKNWVIKSIETKLLTEFKINLSPSSDISYRILPAPHFVIKDSKILSKNSKNQESIADVKILKIFLSKKNFFNKEDMNIKSVSINRANFTLLKHDLEALNSSSNIKFSNKKIEINKSNIFFRNNLNDIITIVKIDNAILFFDDEKLLNLFNLAGNVFTVPFTYRLNNQIDLIKKKKIYFEAKSLNLNILNESIKNKKNSTTGKNIISFLNSKINTNYVGGKKNITFTSNDSRIDSTKIDYSGKLSINPFDLNLNINLNNYRISKLFNFDPILIEFFQSGLLFNDNISLSASITANSNTKEEIFNNAEIKFSILNNQINLNNTKFINNDIGILELRNSNLFLKNNNLILNTDLLFDIKNSDRLFSFLNTNKKSRKEIKSVLINLEYNFLTNEIKFQNIKIDNNEVSDQFLNVIDGFTNNNSNNLIKSRQLLNKLFNIYEG